MKSFTEFVEERTSVDGSPKKRYHSLLDKNGSVKIDKRFAMFKRKSNHPLAEAANLAEMVEALGAEREWGTDTLTRALAGETPGQEDIDLIPNKYAQVAKGDEVVFRIRSVYATGDAAHGQTLSGPVIGADTNRVRIRDENGKLYRVKYIDLL